MRTRELLIIDDDEAIHEGLAAFCKDRNIRSYLALDGPEGLRILEKNPSIHVVLCDIRIPGMDGLDVLKEIKHRDPSTQVILMTAFGEKQLAIQALRYGADDFLEKPLRLAGLGQVLERSFSRIRLRSFASRWQDVLQNLPVGFVSLDPKGVVQGATPGTRDMLGRKARDLIGRVFWKIPEFAQVKSLVLPRENRPSSIEIEVAGHWLVFQIVDTSEEDDQAAGLLAVTDVTGQKSLQAELGNLTSEFETKVEERTRSLSEEAEFSQRLLDTADVLIAYLGPDGRLERLNKFAEEMLGMSRQEAEVAFARLAREQSSPLFRVFDHRSKDELSGMVAEFPVPDGSHPIFTWSARRLKESSGKYGRLIIGIDVTEQKQLEATLQNYTSHLEEVVRKRSTQLEQKETQLYHTARLASLGEMAASIAHEMKQPLNVISITADLIRLLHKNGNLSDDSLHSNLEKIRHTVDRMATTINHLRGFTHIDSTNFENLRMTDAVRGAMSILGEQIRLDDIDVVLEIPDSLPFFKGERNQIEQVLVNLLQNARDAISGERKHRKKRKKQIIVRCLTENQNQDLVTEVTDNGIGMTDEVADRIFEPFYTTKDKESGTGLGLSISLEIIRSHGGDIMVESKEGAGSTFRIVLPVHSDEGPQTDRPTTSVDGGNRASQT